VCFLEPSYTGFIVGFGFSLVLGSGSGMQLRPPAIKWFPAAKTGLIAGIVVAGFGLASPIRSPCHVGC